jgi:hypothetical protein
LAVFSLGTSYYVIIFKELLLEWFLVEREGLPDNPAVHTVHIFYRRIQPDSFMQTGAYLVYQYCQLVTAAPHAAKLDFIISVFLQQGYMVLSHIFLLLSNDFFTHIFIYFPKRIIFPPFSGKKQIFYL